MVGIAEEPHRQLASSVGKRRLNFVIRAGSITVNNNFQIVSEQIVYYFGLTRIIVNIISSAA
jgi:hypothetical protein